MRPEHPEGAQLPTKLHWAREEHKQARGGGAKIQAALCRVPARQTVPDNTSVQHVTRRSSCLFFPQYLLSNFPKLPWTTVPPLLCLVHQMWVDWLSSRDLCQHGSLMESPHIAQIFSSSCDATSLLWMFCTLHPSVPGIPECPKNYILDLCAGNHVPWHHVRVPGTSRGWIIRISARLINIT